MPEYLKRSYSKEEEFLDGFFAPAREAARLFNGDWVPDPFCNDNVRRDREYLFARGELPLTFNAASV